MGSLGFSELLIVLLVGLISLAIPIATLVGVFLVYGKVKNIERHLHRLCVSLQGLQRLSLELGKLMIVR